MKAQQEEKAHLVSYWVPMVIGLLMTIAFAWGLNHQNDFEVKRYTSNLADLTEKLIEKNFEHFEYGLRGLRGVISAVGVHAITREQLEYYNAGRNIEQEFPGALGFGFIKRVPVGQEAKFIEDSRKKVKEANFKIRTLSPHDDDRFVIQHIYPLEQNKQALGLDIGSESNRRFAAISAARNDRVYLTAPITLMQANKKPRKGALVLLPVYSAEANLTTHLARENSVLGWSYAPLVIDDVLADLKFQIDQAFVTLTNIEEREPFYISGDVSEIEAKKYQVSRNIHVLGQSWKLEINPTSAAVNHIKPWDISWIITLGLGLTFLTIFAINLLRINQLSKGYESEDGDIHQLSVRSLSVFIKSNQFKRLLPFSLILLALILFISSGFIIQKHFSNLSDNLNQSQNTALEVLNNEVTQYRRDVLFLANTPVIQDLIQKDSKLYSLENNSANQQQFNERLIDIFKAYMLSQTDVHQVRFISAHEDWQEQVKVQRLAGGLKSFFKEELQSKRNEPYIKQTLRVGDNNTFASDINLNREFGIIEKPERPVWRFSSPLFYKDGSPLGIIIINVSAQQLLSTASKGVPNKTELYITNEQGGYLLHPNKDKSFTFEYFANQRWQDEFKKIDVNYGLNAFDLEGYAGEQGDVFVKKDVFTISSAPEVRELRVYSTAAQFLIYQAIIFRIIGVFLALILIGFISLTIQYWIWLNDIIRQKDILNAQLEEQRKKETVRFKGVLESAPDAIFVIDLLGFMQIVNVQAEKMFGYSRDELEGKSIEKLIPEHLKQDYRARMIGYVKQSQNAVIDSGVEFLALAADGKEFPIEVSLSSIILDEKTLISASVRNISERLIAEEKLRNALREAESATEAKSAFLANTSHEIRTPLNAIIGLGYLLAEEPLTEVQQQLVSKIQISGTSLLGIVNDVLDLAKIEADEMILEEQQVELRELFSEVLGGFAIQAEVKNLKFDFELDPNLPSWVIADNMRLRQILGNLFSNALKFTTIGRIFFSAKVLPDPALAPKPKPTDRVKVRMSIKDTGIGISSDSQKRLFKPFIQADSSTTRRFGGTGLGLSIVQQLVKMMEGEVGIESTENKGSEFWVDLTFKVQTVEAVATQDSHNKSLFVLIAEDEPVDAFQLQRMTKALGWRSEVVCNGDELIKAYLTRQRNKLRPPDAMIVDWEMPVMDGVSAISSLAKQIGRENLPVVLMLSAHDKDAVKRHDHEHLVSTFLTKPIDSSGLFNSVNDVVTLATGNSNRVIQSTHTQAVAAKWLPGVSVLVVDDSSINLAVVSHILEHNGAFVQTANSGEEAIYLLEDPENNYDAVLMDVQMPGIDGLETTQRIRNTLKLSKLPIIALTAGALVEEKNRALASGMNDFFTKPIDPSKLVNVLRSQIETYRGQLLAIESLNANDSKTNTWPVITGLNLIKAKKLLLDDKQLFMSTLDLLLKEHESLSLLPQNNIDEQGQNSLRLQLASQVHKLRSSSGMIGAEKLQQCAAEAETKLRMEGQSVKEALKELALELQLLKQSSKDALQQSHEERELSLMPNDKAPLLHIESIQKILLLLEEQDLDALDKLEEFKMPICEALGNVKYKKLEQYLSKLNFKEAINLLKPLIEHFGSA